MAPLWDLRTLRKEAAFSYILLSLTIMAGNLSSPSKNCVSRWWGAFLEFNLGRFVINGEIQRFLTSQSLRFFPICKADIVLDWGGGWLTVQKLL
ncbi:hypothetical protein Tco_0938430 [Tanacetum coccineum]|uniref:Uncharacterized protein n=1 Tax=Tanacetum coccineum TaxID=301880 RepID=A0ABQ5DH55_9ASTR